MVITMLLAPEMIAFAPRLVSKGSSAIRFIPLHKLSIYKDQIPMPSIESTIEAPDVLILGFGVIGKNVSQVLKATNIPFRVLEMNLNNVKEGKKIISPFFMETARITRL